MLLAVVIVLSLGLLLAADRAVKTVRWRRRRRQASARLAAATARADADDRQRRATAEAGGALASVMPTIHDHAPRRVD